MKKTIHITTLAIFFLLTTSQLLAQFPPRVEDHFWRRKVMNKIDFTEKVNLPLIAREWSWYRQYNQGTETKGLIVALMEGLKSGKYIAYATDSLDKPLDYSQVMGILQEARGEKKTETGGSGDDSGFDDVGGDGGDGGEEAGGGDEWGFGDEFGMGEEAAPEKKADEPISFGAGDEYAPLENYITFVEDRIFDKNRSAMVYDIQYISLYFVDPGGILRDRSVCTFQYKQVMDHLENTQWKSKFNDAENRNMREIFEYRLFNTYIVNVSNINFGVQSLDEAEYRKQQIVEFEHNLWSY